MIWRHDPELLAGPKWPYLMGAGVPLVMLAGLGSVVLWNVEVPPRLVILIGLIFLIPTLFCVLPMLSGIWSRAVAVTRERMVWRSGPAGLGTAEAIARAEIAAATVYEGSAVLILHHYDGRTVRLKWIHEAESLTKALSIPARIWRKGQGVRYAGAAFWPQLVGGLLTVIPIDTILQLIFFGNHFLVDIYGLVTLLLLPLVLAGGLAFQSWAYISAARKLSPADRRIQACRKLNPLCRGEEPLSRLTLGTILTLPFLMFERWLVRKAFGGPYDCECLPDRFGSSVPSTAAAGR